MKGKNETVAEKMIRLKAELELAQAEAAAEETARLEGIATKVRSLPKTLGVDNLADVINLIKQVEKGTLGKLDNSASRTYVRLTDEQKAKIVARLAKGGAGNQVSELANEFGVSVGTVYGLKPKAPAAGATPASAAPAGA